MQPSSREMQVMNSILNQPVQEFDSTSTHRDFFEQVLPALPLSSWPELTAAAAIGGSDKSGDHEQLDLEHQFQLDHDQSESLAPKLRQYQISSGDGNSGTAAVEMKSLLLQQQLLSEAEGPTGCGLQFPAGVPGTGCPGLSLMLPNVASGHNIVNCSSFRPLNSEVEDSVQALYKVFAGSQQNTDQASNQFQHRQLPQDGSMQMPGHGTPVAIASAGGCGGAAAQPKQKIRARRGQATDPHSIAERLRRERIAERMKSLQELVPNANKMDKASMLDEVIDYVKFLQLQVKVLSVSRLGGAAAVGPLGADAASERTSAGGVPTASTSTLNNDHDAVSVTEHQVAKLMEEDMGSAMQYLQGKGLCLMPISLATAISSATRPNPIVTAAGHRSDGGGSSSLSMSGLTVQSATLCNGKGDASV